MKIRLTPELTENEWKKHKAVLATKTGLSEALRKLAKLVEKDIPASDAAKIKLVYSELEAVKTAANIAAKAASKFPQTKAYCGKVITATGTMKQSIEADVKRSATNAAAAEAQSEARTRPVVAALTAAAAESKAAFWQVCQKHAAEIGLNKVSMHVALTNSSADAVVQALADCGIPFKVELVKKMFNQ